MSTSYKEYQNYNMEGKAWGSYSESEHSNSGFSNICNSPKEHYSKMDDSSSLCSSNGSTSNDIVSLPKPPQSLGRRQRRRLCSQTLEVFEFSDIVMDTVILKPECTTVITNEAHVENQKTIIDDEQMTNDRYAALRNLVANDNDSSETFHPIADLRNELPALKHSNPFINSPLDISQSKSRGQMNANRNHDKYSALSDAITISQQTEGEISRNMKWSRSVMGQGENGWSDQVLHGSAEI